MYDYKDFITDKAVYFIACYFKDLQLFEVRMYECDSTFPSNAPPSCFRHRIALFESSQALSSCPLVKDIIQMKMEHQWNDTDRGNSTHSERNPVPVLLCPQQVQHGVTGVRNRAVRSGAGD